MHEHISPLLGEHPRIVNIFLGPVTVHYREVSLYTFPVQTGGIFYFPWHRHQIEGTNGFRCLLRKTQRNTISNVESQVFTPNKHAWSERDSNPDRRRDDKRACYYYTTLLLGRASEPGAPILDDRATRRS